MAQASISDAIECVDYARRKGARIINASFGSYTFNSAAFRDAINSVRLAGIIFPAAAGNDNVNNDVTPLFPAMRPIGEHTRPRVSRPAPSPVGPSRKPSHLTIAYSDGRLVAGEGADHSTRGACAPQWSGTDTVRL
ncbi:MAG: hypothetical protein FJ398_16360 [Verrucomicrobia bacterium]|nr:hypothetical protein [Verrucomicrobiota bacterium]